MNFFEILNMIEVGKPKKIEIVNHFGVPTEGMITNRGNNDFLIVTTDSLTSAVAAQSIEELKSNLPLAKQIIIHIDFDVEGLGDGLESVVNNVNE